MDDDSEHKVDDDMRYDPSDIRGDDEVELTDEESSDDKDDVVETYLLRTLRVLIPMKITRMIRSMNGTRMYLGSIRSHGLTLEFGPNPHQLNVLASLSTIKLDVQNGQHVVGRMMDTVIEETYPELTLLETNSIIRITSDNKREELCEVHEPPVCNVRRYMMIKYFFNNDEEYVAVKEDEYDNLTITREEACRAYQETFQIMDEGWMVTRAGTLEAKNIDEYRWRIYKSGDLEVLES
ncbi:hypothetical protein Tco_0586195 [Tanacetum coccineum]